MTTDTSSVRPRWFVRASAVTSVIALGSLAGTAGPAMAAPPEAWNYDYDRSLLSDLLFVVGVPILVCVLLTLLVYLPSMMRRQSTEPGLRFGDRSEWFGGPRKGVEAAPEGGSTTADADGRVSGDSGKGGAGARW